MSKDSSARGRTGLNIVLYAQHLSGVGHYVRSLEIAKILAERHRVYLVEGGRPVPRGHGDEDVRRIELPRIVRGAAGLESMEPGRGTDAVLRERRRLLDEQVESIGPDVFLIEHFPFSKWEMAGEILGALEAARRVRSGVKVICSVRDVLRRTRFEAAAESEYRDRVLGYLNDHFDAVLVHGDPRLFRIERHFPAAVSIGIPLHYTGIVSERLPDEANGKTLEPASALGLQVLVSVGGGRGDERFPELCIAAWRLLLDQGVAAGGRMRLCTGVDWPRARLDHLRSAAEDAAIDVVPYSVDFLKWMSVSALTVAHAGYNTCANILETRARALLVPDPQMSDQPVRAQRLAEMGLVDTVSMQGLSAADLAVAMKRALERTRPDAGVLALDGAARTQGLVEIIASGGWPPQEEDAPEGCGPVSAPGSP